MAVSRELPLYVSHKEVRALKISSVAGNRLWFVDPRYGPRDVEDIVFSRYTPVRGDYFVVYADGYESISPQKAFEDGYVLETK